MNDEQLIKEFEEKLNRERELDNINLDDFGLESLSADFNQASLNNSNKEGNTECNRVCDETHPSLMSILTKKSPNTGRIGFVGEKGVLCKCGVQRRERSNTPHHSQSRGFSQVLCISQRELFVRHRSLSLLCHRRR